MNEFILKYQGKELKMPQWGDFGEYVVAPNKNFASSTSIPIKTKQLICDKNTNISANLLVDGRDGLMDIYQKNYHPFDIVVDRKYPLKLNTTHELNTKFNGLFKDCVYGEGDDIAVKVRRFDKLKVGDIFEYGSGGGKIIISYDSVRGCFNFFINGDINFCYIGLESIKDGYYKGNLLDEYLEGKNELAKMVGFD